MRISRETHDRLLAKIAEIEAAADPALLAAAKGCGKDTPQKGEPAYDLAADRNALSELASSFATGLNVRAAVRKRALALIA